MDLIGPTLTATKAPAPTSLEPPRLPVRTRRTRVLTRITRLKSCYTASMTLIPRTVRHESALEISYIVKLVQVPKSLREGQGRNATTELAFLGLGVSTRPTIDQYLSS